MSAADVSIEQFDWLKLKDEIGSEEVRVETGFEKLERKVKENPFVPLGAIATTACLACGLHSFRRGQPRLSQLMMRGRVIAQGFTVAALIGGVFVAASKKS